MADFEAGQAWISLMASGRGLSQSIKKELAKQGDVSKTLDLEIDAKQVREAIAEVKKELQALEREKVEPSVDFDASVLSAKIDEAKSKLDDLGKKEATPSVRVKIAETERDLSKLTRQLEALEARRADVTVDAQIAEGQAKLEKLGQMLDKIERRKAEPKVTADTSVAMGRLAELDQRLLALSQQTATPEVELQVARAQQEALRIRAELERLGAMKPSPQVNADITAAAAKLAVVNQQLTRLDAESADVTVTANVSSAQMQLVALQAQLSQLDMSQATPEVQVQAAQAQQEILRLGAELTRLGAMAPTAQVNADTASAQAKIAMLRSQIDSIGNKRVDVNVDASSSGRASILLMGVVAALGAIGAAAPAAVAALAAVGGAAGAVGQGVAAGMAGFVGIGDALKALEADEKSAATSSASSSGTRATGAKQVASAQRGLEQAQIQADRAAITGGQQVAQAQQAVGQARSQQARTAVSGAQQVAEAERALAQAVQSAGRTQITSSQQVADAVQAAARARISSDQQVAQARRAVSDAVVSANARVASAERSLESANRARQNAQEALTRATQDAARANRDLQLSVAGGALATERATISLEQARQRLAQAGAGTDPLALADLSLSVREAEQNLKETQVRYGDLTQEQAKWARTGVQGSDQVVSATQALQDAQRGVADSQRGLTEAQVSGARQVSDAQEGLARAQQQAAWSAADAQKGVSRAIQQAAWANIDAQRGVADAQRAVGAAAESAAQANADAADQVSQAQQGVAQAVQQAAWQQEDAARGIADAQRQLADAYTSGGEAAAGGAKQAEYALGKLTPAGRSMVDFLKNEWQPTWKKTTDAVAEEMLPKVEQAMRNALKLEPTITAGLVEAGGILGDLAIRGSELATSPPFMANFASIMASNNRQLQSYGDAGLHTFGALTDLWTVAGPVSERFARLAENSMQAFESWVIGQRASGDLGRNMQSAGDVLMWLGGLLIDVSVDVYQVLQSLAPLGVAVLEVVRYTTDWIAWWAQLNPMITSFAAGAALAAVGASKLGTAMKGLSVAQSAANVAAGTQAAGLGAFANVARTVFVPAAATAALNSTKLGAAATGAGGKFGTLAGGATKVAGSLPLIGVAAVGLYAALDAVNDSTAEVTEGLQSTGQAALTARDNMRANDQAAADTVATYGKVGEFSNWLDSMFGVSGTTKDATAELEKQRSTMSGLERAQSIAAERQGDYEDVLRRFPPASTEVRTAQDLLSQATADVAREQENARRATMNATQALTDQQNKILGSINARLGLEQSVRSTKTAQDEYAAAVRNSGAGSDEAKDAEIRLQQAQTAQADAAMRAAAEEAKKKGVVDTSAASNLAYSQSVGDMVAKTTGQLTPALQSMIQGMDYAGLSAAGAKVKIDGAGNAVAVFPNGKTVQLDANTSPVYPALAAVKQAVDSTKGTVGVDADPGPATATVGGFKLNVDATTGTVGINGNISAADQARLGIKAKTDGTTGTMFVDGNPVPCDGELNGMRVKVDKTTGVMTVDANPQPANSAVDGVQGNASTPQSMPLGMDTKPAESTFGKFVSGMLNVLQGIPGFGPTIAAGRALIGYNQGGVVAGYAAGGAIQHKQVMHGYAAGAGGSKRIAKSDTVPAMLTPGEFVVRKQSVEAVGLKTLTAINGMARGGPVGFAAGGAAKPLPAGGAPAAAAAPVPVPTGDPAAASAAAGATGALSAQMASAATTAGMLAPALAAVTAGQQQMTTSGVTPLVGAMTGSLFPALSQYGMQVGVQAPLANQQLQAAQVATQVSTAVTAANTAVNSAAMTAATTGMSLAAQAQHAGLRAGQAATQVSTNLTAQNAAANNAKVAATTTGMSVQSQAQHAGLRAGQAATQVSSNITAANSAATNAGMAAATAGMSQTSQLQHTGLRLSQGQTVMANNALAQNTQVQTANMSGATIGMSGTVQNHLGQVRGAQGVTAGSTTAFADSWRAQLARTMPDSGNPLKWVINFPIRSITDAWNHLDGQFALGKRVAPYVPNFATGGSVSGPGGGTDDKVPAMLSNGEFVVREAVTSRVGPFLRALNAGQPEALQAASAGRRPDPMVRMAGGGSVSDAIARATNVARSMSGKPYIWGGASPAGADCSGYQSIITNALRGDGNVYRRIGTTGTFPWGGFTPGLTSAYSIGAFKGNPGHMAGTLAGVNVESGGSPSRVKFGAGAVGADNGQFNTKASLPVIGGQFVSGGAGGGGGFDPTPAVDEAFAKTYREIGDVPKLFGPSDQVARGQGVAKFSADKVKAKALEKLMAMFASSGGGGNAAMWRPQIAQALGLVGQPLAHVGITERRMNQESGGNPRAINNWDSNARKGTPSKGLMQVIDPTFRANWDPRTKNDIWDPVANITASMHYALRRYGSLPAAYNRPGGYDNGGLLQPGRTLVENNTGFPERVLSNVETRSYDTLTQLVGKNGVKVEMAPYEPQRAAPVFENLNVTTPQGATTADVARAINFGVKSVKRGGVHA